MLEQPSAGPYEQFLLFGDSITQQSCAQDRGYAFMPALQNTYIRRLDVINRGFSGYNTANALKILPEFLPNTSQAQIRYMTVFFGANDACLPSSSTGQHVPLTQYKENLKKIIDHPSLAVQQPRLILITPPPVDEYQLEESHRLNGSCEIMRTADHTKLYADACREVGKELGVVVLDLWSAFMSETGWNPGQPLPGSKATVKNLIFQDLFSDGLHLNPNGYKVLYREIVKTIEAAWSEKHQPSENAEGNLPSLRFPLWEFAPKC